MGFCVPFECKNDDLDNFVHTLFGFVNKQLVVLPSYGINFDLLIFNNKSQVGSRFTVPEEYNKIQEHKTVTGRRVMVTLICMIVLASVGSNITWAIQHLIATNNDDDERVLPFEIAHNLLISQRKSVSNIKFSENVEQDVEKLETIRTSRIIKSEETPREEIRKSDF